MKTLKLICLALMASTSAYAAKTTEPKVQQASEKIEPPVEAAAPAAEERKKKGIALQGDLGFGKAIFPAKRYNRVPFRLSGGLLIKENFSLQVGYLTRVGTKPQLTTDTGLDLNARLRVSESVPFFGIARLGYVAQKIEWRSASWRPAYSSYAFGSYLGAGAGYEIKTRSILKIVPELSWDYTPKATFKKKLGGNSVYSPSHHNVEFTVGLRADL